MDLLLRLAPVLLLCLPVSGNIPKPPDMSQGLYKTLVIPLIMVFNFTTSLNFTRSYILW